MALQSVNQLSAGLLVEQLFDLIDGLPQVLINDWQMSASLT
jgi:hypothetical protein